MRTDDLEECVEVGVKFPVRNSKSLEAHSRKILPCSCFSGFVDCILGDVMSSLKNKKNVYMVLV